MYFVEKTKGTNFIKQFDYLLFLSVILLSTIGIVVLDSATNTMTLAEHSRYMNTQALSLIIGVSVALIICVIDYKYYIKPIGILFYLTCVVLLVIVLFKGMGYSSGGSSSWLRVPIVGSFQPSELAKIAFIVFISIFFERIKEGQAKKNVFKLIFYSILPIGLVIAQLDFGTAMVYIFIFFMLIFICGIKYRYIFMTMGAALITAPFFWFFVLNEKRKARVLEFISPGSDQLGSSYQLNRAEMAIGSGQIYGSGLYKGIQTQNGGVPVKESDFIFTVIGEELGFIGAMVVIVLIFCILLRCIYIAKNSRDYYGAFLVIGLSSMFGFHFMENIGMCVRILPVTGIPLPFVSAGGSAMITNYIALGIILSVSIRRRKTIFNSSQ